MEIVDFTDLTAALYAEAARTRREGVLTLFVGGDDDHGSTTLFGRELWPDVPRHAASVEATARGHAITFFAGTATRSSGCFPT